MICPVSELSNTQKNIESINADKKVGKPLAPWTYTDPELFEIEYQALFLSRWQFVGHVNDVTEVGDFITADIGRDNVVIIRGNDSQLRAFLNVCRHRASRIFEGSGTCRGVIRCPYHGWTYKLDGSLMAIPQEETLADVDRSKHGLHKVQLDEYNGLLFARVKGDGPGVAEQFAHTGHYFEKFDVANHLQIADESIEIWDVNWKVAWDNYLENYHIPIGHPGLHRLLRENDEWDELTSGVSYGVFLMRDKLSSVEHERRYQEMLHHSDHRLPDDAQGKWVQFGLTPNLGIDLYPEMLDTFQLVPLAHDKTLVRTKFYGHQNPTREEQELRRLNMLINGPVNDEDRVICERVQKGLRTDGYQPGPLSQLESCVSNFHEMLRDLIPVMSMQQAPHRGSVAAANADLANQ